MIQNQMGMASEELHITNNERGVFGWGGSVFAQMKQEEEHNDNHDCDSKVASSWGEQYSLGDAFEYGDRDSLDPVWRQLLFLVVGQQGDKVEIHLALGIIVGVCNPNCSKRLANTV